VSDSGRKRDNHPVQSRAERELLAPVDDVWALLAEPYHLADWWPGYAAIRPDRRGLVEGARWQVARGGRPGLFRRPRSEGLVLIVDVVPGRGFTWRDLQQRFSAEIRIEPTEEAGTLAAVRLEATMFHFVVEELRRAPRQALARLHALCQTAAGL
jgi:uncharacterized protein YndB with AHSA1/START domain